MTSIIIAYSPLIVIYILVLILTLNSRIDSEITTKDAWEAVLWPLALTYTLIKLLLWCFNSTILFIAILFKINYNKTKIYRIIDDVCVGDKNVLY